MRPGSSSNIYVPLYYCIILHVCNVQEYLVIIYLATDCHAIASLLRSLFDMPDPTEPSIQDNFMIFYIIHPGQFISLKANDIECALALPGER